jgi:taurine dioxygenase
VARDVADTAPAPIEFEALTPYTGVRLPPGDVTELDDAQVAEVGRLASTYGVVVLPGRPLAPADLAAFTARLGPPMFTPGEDPIPEHPHVHRAPTSAVPDRPRVGAFHTDTSFVARPPAYTLLHAVDIPATGGDTMFSNQYLAYDALSPVLQRFLDGLRLRHRVSGVRRPEDAAGTFWHPAVRINPVTDRRALYVTFRERCDQIEGMSPAESAVLLEFLYRHSQDAGFVYRHRWSLGDLVVWDDRCTMHAAVQDFGDSTRVMHRTMVQGEEPVGPHGLTSSTSS